MQEMGSFAHTVMNERYAHTKKDGTKETWAEIAQRVAKYVMGAVDAPKFMVADIAHLIEQRKFLPGGRYLFAAGRPYHQVQNCYEGSTEVITLQGTQTLAELAGTIATLMTSEGRWINAPVYSFGTQPLMKVTLTRAGITKELWATPEHSWRVAENTNKDGRPQTKTEVLTRELQSDQKLWSVYGYGISRTPLSLAGIQHGIVFGDGNVPGDEWGFNTANVRLCGEKDAQLLKYFAGYPTHPLISDVEVSGLPRRYKLPVSLQEDRAYLLGWLAGYMAADGCVSEDGVVSLASADKKALQLVKDVCYVLGIGAYGIRANNRISNLTGEPSCLYSVVLMRHTLTPDFFLVQAHKDRFCANPPKRAECQWSVVSVENTTRVDEVFCAVVEGTHEFVLADNILTGNCLLLRAEDSREGWSDLLRNSAMALMTGAGIGTGYSLVRGAGKPIRKTGGVATGPLALMQMVNEVGRGIRQGGTRRSAIWAGLSWKHADIHKFIAIKNWSHDVRAMKVKDVDFPATLDMTNVSVGLDDEFFEAIGDDKHPLSSLATSVYWDTIERMLKTGEPGFSVDCGANKKEILRNACTEVSSADDSDICNLGSINMSRITDLVDFKTTLELAVAFLVAGTVYSDVPYSKVDMVRTKNRRLGLGLMGVHEWLLTRGKQYEPDAELEQYLNEYAASTDIAAQYANKWELSQPIKTRAIAPNGTIGIVAETSTGIEPIYCAAYKRRYAKGNTWCYQYVVDPTAKRLVERGVDPDKIEDAYSLAENVERRVAFQVWMQKFVDHGISSTINLPHWGSEHNNQDIVVPFGQMLLKHLPSLRGITAYPDGARSGQPIQAVSFKTAMKHTGEVFVENSDVCEISRGESCGS